jgi:hypothetical protein
MGALLALVAALPVALLPPDAAGLPEGTVKAAKTVLQRALPAPWEAAKLGLAALEQHLAAAGPARRTDLAAGRARPPTRCPRFPQACSRGEATPRNPPPPDSPR